MAVYQNGTVRYQTLILNQLQFIMKLQLYKVHQILLRPPKIQLKRFRQFFFFNIIYVNYYELIFQVIPAKKIRPRPVPKPAPSEKNVAWDIPPIQCYEPDDGVFYAQMGPTGGKHGYSAITGKYVFIQNVFII